ncbi:histidinol-phosphate transaminase [Sutcliffiella cohnii]|uniref:histidinol-phosphate transaminase n=1 Tax=Sutcliffiella cohnii TaxID=33932 RepID=UPI002E22AC59|nr:histidinol-phosphate transaminase [Sutcliffiella cohnii]
MTVKAREVLNNMKAYPLNKSIEEVQAELGFEKAYKLAENENIFGCSPKIKANLSTHLNELFTYPDGHARQLTSKLAQFHQLHFHSIFIGNGSDEIIRLLCRAFICNDDEAVMADVTFPRYKTNVLIEGGKPIIVPLQNGVHDLSSMLRAITSKTKLVFICNPNNPTGTIINKQQLLEFIDQVPNDCLVVLDEAYYEYADNEQLLQSVPLLHKYPNLVILRTFSKAYGLAALRIGYGMMSPIYVDELTKVKDVFNVNQLGQIAASLALEDQQFINDCVTKNKTGKEYLEKELTVLNYDFYPSQANFIMIHTKRRGDYAANSLLKHGFIVRAGTLLGLPYTIRVTISSMEDNIHFINTFKNLAAEGEV